jgi:hypothetical protein
VELCAGDKTVTLPSPRWPLATFTALVLGLLLWTEDADARFEGGSSFGGGDAFLSLPAGSIAAADLTAFDGEFLLPSVAQQTYPGGSLGGLFNRPGLIGGFAAGFLGAGLLGLLFGHGVVGELSGVASVLGLVFQLTLIVMLARLIWTWWRDDRADALATLSPRQLADAYGRSRNETLPDIGPVTGADATLGEPAKNAFKHKD